MKLLKIIQYSAYQFGYAVQNSPYYQSSAIHAFTVNVAKCVLCMGHHSGIISSDSG